MACSRWSSRSFDTSSPDCITCALSVAIDLANVLMLSSVPLSCCVDDTRNSSSPLVVACRRVARSSALVRATARAVRSVGDEATSTQALSAPLMTSPMPVSPIGNSSSNCCRRM